MTRAELRQAKRTDKSLLRYRQQKIGLNPKKIIQNWICDVLVFVMVRCFVNKVNKLRATPRYLGHSKLTHLENKQALGDNNSMV